MTALNTVEHCFSTHMELVGHVAGEQAQAIADAGQCLVDTLVNDGKIFSCGNGVFSIMAHYLTSCLLNRHTLERPALPAFNLAADITSFSAMCKDNRYNELFARQIKALGRPGDTLVIFSEDGREENLIQAAEAAHETDISVIRIYGGAQAAASRIHQPRIHQGNDHDIILSDLPAQITIEMATILVNALCAVIDNSLFNANPP